ncbi:MAG: AAA family ATPase [Candidatus Obscuribacterales bacterium]
MSHAKHPTVLKFEGLITEMDRIIVEYPLMKRMTLLCLIADGHLLLESVPGLGKTLTVDALTGAVENSSSHAFQMTPDMKPGDILGGLVFNPQTGLFEVRKGPIIGKNFVIADEINRTTPKTLSALLRAMQERYVVIGDELFELEEPFLVLATQNPIEQEGTFPLPEALLDRFAVKIRMTYIGKKSEIELLRRVQIHGRKAKDMVKKVITKADILEARAGVADVATNTTDAIREYIVDLTRATRPEDSSFSKILDANGKPFNDVIQVGASPRCEIWTLHMAAAQAFLSGRTHIIPDDVKFVFPHALRHRIVPSQRARLGAFDLEAYLTTVMDQVKVISDK